MNVEVQRILEEVHAGAARLLLKYRPQLDALAEALLEHETLEAHEILTLTGLPHSPRLHDRRRSIHPAVLRWRSSCYAMPAWTATRVAPERDETWSFAKMWLR